jgi:Tfp pilus assembly protein PilN
MKDASFLPEDYLAKLAERRTNVVSLTLFVVVMAAVFGAFLVTNRQASQIRQAQADINEQYKGAALKIDELNELESQRDKMLHKAELATALVERVPRSILLAELINRMPSRLSLQEFEIKSTPIKAPPPKPSGTQSLRDKNKGPERIATREEAQETKTVEAPKYVIEIIMVGVAPTDLEVSRYITELNAYKLLQDVTLKYSVQTTINEQTLREFRVEMKLAPDADIRKVDPLLVPRTMRDPMIPGRQFTLPEPQPADETGNSAGAPGGEPQSANEGGQ